MSTLDAALLWIILGGFMEPVWVIALKRYNDSKSIPWMAVAVFFMIASPLCLSIAMKTMSVGISYAIWTGLGAVFTMLAGMVLYKERPDRLKVFFVFLIIVGVVGLQLSAEAGL